MVGLVVLELRSLKAEFAVPKRVSLSAKHCRVPLIAWGSWARRLRERTGLDSRSTRPGPDAHQPSCSARFLGCLVVHLIGSVLKKLSSRARCNVVRRQCVVCGGLLQGQTTMRPFEPMPCWWSERDFLVCELVSLETRGMARMKWLMFGITKGMKKAGASVGKVS
jgi:hypothetical protein